MIVAWHEVPGTGPPQKSRPVGYGAIRAGVRRFEDWSSKIPKSKTEIIYVVFSLPMIQFLCMANTLSCLNIHCVFSTKERVGVLDPDIRERLWPYMGGIAKQNGMIPKCIGGVSDHVHLLVTLPTRLAVAKAVQLIKAGSSAWIHQTFPNLRNFAWQQGYGAFSVGISQVQETVHYIEQQLEHHRTRTFQEEYLAFLKKHGAHFDEKYLWD
jgi:putative transposase